MDSEKIIVKRIFCAIVGAGMCGISLGDRFLATGTLKRDEFVIFDKNNDFGGVWETNRYPGAACDIPSHAYVMKTCLNADWSKKFAEGKEIQQYYARFANRRCLQQNTCFNTYVHEARWNEQTLLWDVLVEDRKTGQKTKWIANVIFDNGGGFHSPKFANIPGRDSFNGEQWHTAEWPADADLRGKRVALIGTGPSAAQVAPKIQPIVKQLYMFQRSCGHVLPRNNQDIPSWKRTLFQWFYPILWLYHVSWFVFFDRTKAMWMSGTDENRAMHKACIDFLEHEVKDPAVKEKLRPTDEFGCKRVLFLDNWYSMFNERNVALVTEKPVRITENSIVVKSPNSLTAEERAAQPKGSYQLKTPAEISDGETELEIDVLIWGTGFDMNNSGGHFQIYGMNGKNLSQTWKDYPETYWSVAVTDFPSLFLTLGPNSTNYWSNITTVVEIQVNYHCKVLQRIKKEIKKGPYAVYPDGQVQDGFNDWLKNNRGSPAFLSGQCATYHKTPAGATPMYNHYRIWNYYWKMLGPRWGDFVQLKGLPKASA
ncbi:hypothetical protein G7Z17_g2138 [Cylindrodendrum hubeiense]|uniref:Uncharacterized protein n=1 Tax=Cylindrodendrum hubeiense TaxID=595255 RepID=A0A9P5HET4_9HYPO|nr:hypothetical protein G7Z17_g2138 [Cylindrodendrum hubeiense]